MPAGIEIPPYQQTSPSDTARAWESGFGEGSSAVQGALEIKQQRAQLQQQRTEFEQQYQLQKQRAAVADEVLKQRQAILTQNAAAASKAMMDYQNAIQSGMDPAKAAMMFGPAMSSGRMTGYSPIFSDYERAHAPSVAPSPVTDGSGKTIGYSDRNGNVHYIPQPKATAPMYEQTTTVDPGTPSIPGTPATAPESHMFGLWETPGKPAIPGIQGKPKTTTVKRIPIPMGPAYDQATTNAPAPSLTGRTTVQADVDDPLGILNK